MKLFFEPATALALLGATIAPAFADWQGTQWGMSPQEALAVLDGANSYQPEASEVFQFDGASYQPLIKLAYRAEGIAGEASLLFDSEDALQFVVFSPEDITQCDALTSALAETYGAAEESGFGSTAIYNWADGETLIRLTNSSDIGICNLSYGAI